MTKTWSTPTNPRKYVQIPAKGITVLQNKHTNFDEKQELEDLAFFKPTCSCEGHSRSLGRLSATTTNEDRTMAQLLLRRKSTRNREMLHNQCIQWKVPKENEQKRNPPNIAVKRKLSESLYNNKETELRTNIKMKISEKTDGMKERGPIRTPTMVINICVGSLFQAC